MTAEYLSTVCAECGDELEDFTPCACIFAGPPKPVRPQPTNGKSYRTSMRTMVQKKLAARKARR